MIYNAGATLCICFGFIMASVILRGVKKSFHKSPVINGIDIEIADRDFVVFIGPSGCGKSTILRLIAGLEEPTDGDIFINNRRVNDLPPAKRGVAMVFQSFALYPHMSAYENMAFGLRLSKQNNLTIREKVCKAAETLGISHLLERKPKELSGGQRQRVAIGRAIVREPEVFLFDEPLSNLDADLRARMRVEIAGLHKELNTTMIYVTHDQTEAMTMADKIALLSEGTIQQYGAPLELYGNPENIFVAGFIGSPKMNFIDAEIVMLTDKTPAVSLPGDIVFSLPAKCRDVAPGDNITLGVRPEHVLLNGKGEIQLSAEIYIIERLGGESYIHLMPDNTDNIFIVRVHGDTKLKAGERTEVSFLIKNCSLFNKRGKRL